MKTNMRAICPICSDLYNGEDVVVAAPCGHVFHGTCLLIWINQSETCPDCRTHVTEDKIIRLNFSTVLGNDTFNDIAAENEICDLKAKLIVKDKELEKEKLIYEIYCDMTDDRIACLKQGTDQYESDINNLNLKLKSLTKLKAKVRKLKKSNAALTKDLRKAAASSLKHSARPVAKNRLLRKPATVELKRRT